MKLIIINIFVFLFVNSIFMQNVDADSASIESNIVKQVERDLPRSLMTLEKIVNINSGSMNFDGVKDVGRHLIEELKTLGFKTHWQDGSSFNRAGHLVASYGNNQSNTNILLITSN